MMVNVATPFAVAARDLQLDFTERRVVAHHDGEFPPILYGKILMKPGIV